MALEHEIVKWLDSLIAANLEFRRIFDPDDTTLKLPGVNSDSPTKIEALEQSSTESTFESLKEALNSDKWPKAVHKNLICDPNSDKDKIERGKGIIELMIEGSPKGLKLLDYGCGEGHCAFLSSDYETTLSMGYDIIESERWKQFEGRDTVTLTTNYNNVVENGPYDIIILFDVIDHVKNENPTQLLKKVYDLLLPGGKVYMRCHPFTSRHATHLYHDLNKAYVHLVFTEEELQQLAPSSKLAEKNIGITYPIATYDKHIEEAGLTIINRRDIREEAEGFFKIPKIANRIMQITGHKEFPEFQMSLQFIDYVLSK